MRSAELQIGEAQVRVNAKGKSSITPLSRPATSSVSDFGITPWAAPGFESNNKLWLVIVLSIALGAALMYLLKR
jgi:hypothetical protein